MSTPYIGYLRRKFKYENRQTFEEGEFDNVNRYLLTNSNVHSLLGISTAKFHVNIGQVGFRERRAYKTSSKLLVLASSNIRIKI